MDSELTTDLQKLPVGQNSSIDVETILNDYRICCISREVSIHIRKEVLTGKAKFGVSDDGKEVLQVAMAHAYRKGDFRAEYYRGNTLLLALGLAKVEDFFAQLYADPENDPFSAGRQMVNHHATSLVDKNGDWLDLKNRINISSDISTTAGQMARAVGLAFASKKYRQSEKLRYNTLFSDNGNEVCFCNIGDGSTSEGAFWEAVNAAGVLQIPLAVSVWDDGYAISVPVKYQTIKESISKALRGFETDSDDLGMKIYTVNGWDYPKLVKTYKKGIAEMRETHSPALFHIQELTQPQGHSTSGSHERYKSSDRLAFERAHDCNKKFKEWILEEGLAKVEQIEQIEEDAKKYVKDCKNRAWAKYRHPIDQQVQELQHIYQHLLQESSNEVVIQSYVDELNQLITPFRAELMSNARRIYYALIKENLPAKRMLKQWINKLNVTAKRQYSTNLYSDFPNSALKIPVIDPTFSEESKEMNAYQVINFYFDLMFEKHENLYAFGEDVGQIGDVNQGFAGLQEKYGKERIFDTGIREWTIVGQAIGMTMRGLRVIAEIQYLDYLLYGLVPLSDDLATLTYRTNGIQKAPVIIRTRGHRLEGIWHSGSPMSLLLSSLRGLYLCVPRNFVQAAGMYNTLLQSDDSAVLIECLNGYRLKETLPDNMGDYTVPLGKVEVLQEGTDVTLVTYGSCVRIAEAGIKLLMQKGISVELIDVQTLLPFDLDHQIVQSLQKTNRIVFLDEDVPGGAAAYMMQEVLEKQKGYFYLDSAPQTLTAKAHRPAYGSDGDYFSKPNAEDVFEVIYEIMYDAEPNRFEGEL
ncbi:MAG: thiamine pyrophosphate-dependent enzyme [Chitinophagales bacterium]